jgi:ankyrin repeat protein
MISSNQQLKAQLTPSQMRQARLRVFDTAFFSIGGESSVTNETTVLRAEATLAAADAESATARLATASTTEFPDADHSLEALTQNLALAVGLPEICATEVAANSERRISGNEGPEETSFASGGKIAVAKNEASFAEPAPARSSDGDDTLVNIDAALTSAEDSASLTDMPKEVGVKECICSLERAIMQGDAEQVKRQCINSSDPRGFALASMIGATIYGAPDIFRMLAKEFSLPMDTLSLQKQFDHDICILHWAAVSGSDLIIELLVAEFQVDVNELSPSSQSSQVYSELWTPSENCDWRRQWRGHGYSSYSKKNTDISIMDALGEFDNIALPFETLTNHVFGRSSALLIATIEGRISTAQLLISLGAVVDAPNENGETPLQCAIEWRRENIVELLLSHGAEIPINPLVAKPPLCHAAEFGYDGIIHKLVAYGADVTSQNNDGWQPIHIASARGHESTVRVLVEFGASVNSTVEHEGWTCASILVREAIYVDNGADKEALLMALFELGADLDQADMLGLTPLHLAADDNLVSTVRLLCELGADVNAECNEGYTPLLVAAQHGHDAVIDILASEFGARIDAVGLDGRTAATVAALNGHATTVELLSELGADFEPATPDGFSVFHFASIGGFETITSYLEDVKAMQDVARSGTVAVIQEKIVSGLQITAPVQWLKLLPENARKELAAWTSSCLIDSKACYSAIFHPVFGESTCALRTKVAHDGHSHIKKSIVSFLVHESPETRRVLSLLDRALESLESIIEATEQAESDLEKARRDMQRAHARMGKWAIASRQASKSLPSL